MSRLSHCLTRFISTSIRKFTTSTIARALPISTSTSSSSSSCTSHTHTTIPRTYNHHHIQTLISQFDTSLPVEKAETAPASWYTSPDMFAHEKHTVFNNSWLCIGRSDQVHNVGDYFTGCILNEPYVVVRDENTQLRAFYNVCRHHAARVAENDGNLSQFVCPYHGWTYALNGRLRKATRLKTIANFKASAVTLKPIAVSQIGPLIFINMKEDANHTKFTPSDIYGDTHLHNLLTSTSYHSLKHIKRRIYEIRCNWKVFVDNYLDGGYHVPHAHGDLASLLDESSYKSEVFGRYSIQSVTGSSSTPTKTSTPASTSTSTSTFSSSSPSPSSSPPDRIGSGAHYVYLYPNLMLNRYGSWLDINIVEPLAIDRCRVIFDYFIDESALTASLPPTETLSLHLDQSFAASHQVQVEDTYLCESVQSGLESNAYHTGRYAPTVEFPMHHFHRLLHADLSRTNTDTPTTATATVTTDASPASTS